MGVLERERVATPETLTRWRHEGARAADPPADDPEHMGKKLSGWVAELKSDDAAKSAAAVNALSALKAKAIFTEPRSR